VDEEEDRRLALITPDITRITVTLLRRVVGLYPEERVPQEALRIADEVLTEYGTDGLRLLAVSLTAWAAVGIEREARDSGRSLEALLDEMDLLGLEAVSGELGGLGADDDGEDGD
jgi:hypothetical protein